MSRSHTLRAARGRSGQDSPPRLTFATAGYMYFKSEIARKWACSLFVAVVMAGCGPAQTVHRDETPRPAVIAGQWRGTTWIVAEGVNRAYATTVRIAYENDLLTVNNLCNDGTGSATFTPEGGVLAWSGGFGCAAGTTACPSAQYQWTQIRLEQRNTGIALDLRGALVGCDMYAPASGVFYGQRVY